MEQSKDASSGIKEFFFQLSNSTVKNPLSR
jgi:hypothetical protein